MAEAWAWLRRRLAKLGRGWFSSLGLETWSERTVTFAALLEAVRQGQVRLRQKGAFADLWIEIEPEQEERSA